MDRHRLAALLLVLVCEARQAVQPRQVKRVAVVLHGRIGIWRTRSSHIDEARVVWLANAPQLWKQAPSTMAGIDKTPAPGHYDAPAAHGRSRAPAWVIKPSHFSRSMAKSDNTPGPGSYFAGSGQVGEAYSEITRFGGEMLTKASKTWAHRNPGTSMAIRFDPLDAF